MKGNNRLYWFLQVSGWLGMVGIEIINFTFFIAGKFDWELVKLFGYGALLGLMITHVFRHFVKKSNVFDWRPRYIWLLAFLSTLVMSVAMNLLFYLPSMLSNGQVSAELFTFIGLLGGTINWMRYVGVWVILYFMYRIIEKTSAIREEKLKSENIARVTELELLKTQLNPHFLFNALNSIKALVTIDQEKCKDAIVKLSELLRFTLNYENQTLIPLHDELAVVRKYLSLEKIRFGERLQLEFEVDDATLNRLVPPALILVLAENAIKHGVTKQAGDCTVTVKTKVNTGVLTIEMRNPGKLELEKKEGIGLPSIRMRLHYLFGDRASFSIIQKDELVISTICIEYV